MQFELDYPHLLSDEAKTAIETHRHRLERAVEADDRPAVVGAAKELIESIARCTLDATEDAVEDRADLPKLVHAAQRALKRAAGKDISGSSSVTTIANAAKQITVGISELRNQLGTGHGRSRVPDVDDEVLEVVIAGTMLWCRWALRRLGHVLADYPTFLLAAVNSGTSRDALQQALDDVRLPEQPQAIQHTIGAAFGRQAAGGFGNAVHVGVTGAAASSEIGLFPIPYRLGLVEGAILNYDGQLGLPDWLVPAVVDVLSAVPTATATPELAALSEKARSATWISRWRGSSFDPAETIVAMRRDATRLPAALKSAFDQLVAAMDPAARVASGTAGDLPASEW